MNSVLCTLHILAKSVKWEQICSTFICSLYPYSILCCVFFPCPAHEHSKWEEAETWNSEKRSAKGYEVEKRGEWEHLKADLGNMQGQRAPKDFFLQWLLSFCLTYPWHWQWGRFNPFFSRNLLFDFHLNARMTCTLFRWLNLVTLLVRVRSPRLCLCWHAFNVLNAALQLRAPRPVNAHAHCRPLG